MNIVIMKLQNRALKMVAHSPAQKTVKVLIESAKKLTPIQLKRVGLYMASLNPRSKWYDQDLAEFIENVKKESPALSLIRLKNVEALQSEAFEKEVAKEEAKMAKAGLYDIGKMKPKNALD